MPGYYPEVNWTKIEEKTHSLQASSDYMALPYRILTLLANHYLMSFGRLSSAAIENIAWFCSKTTYTDVVLDSLNFAQINFHGGMYLE